MVTDMTVGKPLKQIMTFFVPILFSTFFQQLYGIADSAIVGKFISKDALAAIGTTASLNWLVISFIIGFVSGCGVLVARAFGAKNHELMRRVIANGIYVCATVAIVLTLLFSIFCRRILVLIDTPADIFSDAYSYIFIIILGYPITIASNYIGMLIRSVGDSKTAMIRGIISAFVNISLDLLFVIVFNMGVSGAAVATVTATTVDFFIGLLFYIKKFQILHINKQHFKLNTKIIRETVCIGLPMGLQSGITMIGCTLVQSSVNSLGTEYVAAFSISNKMVDLLGTPVLTLCVAATPFMSQNYGAYKADRIFKAFWQIVLIAIGYAAVCSLVLIAFCRKIALMYVNSSETETLEKIQFFFNHAGWFVVFLFVLFIVRNSIQSLGYSKFTMFGGFIELACRLVIVFVLFEQLGFTVITLSGAISWIFTDAMLIAVFMVKIRKDLKRLQLINNKSNLQESAQ